MARSKPSILFPEHGSPYFEFCLFHPPTYDDVVHTVNRLHDSGDMSYTNFLTLTKLAIDLYDKGVLN